MPSIQVGKTLTAYQDIGRHPKTLLLLHGWGNSWEAWSPLIPALSAQYRLLIPDLPGFGRSSSPETGWSTMEFVSWLKAFLDELKINELEAVLGHSYGGKLSAFAWSKESTLPVPAKGLFLIGPSGIPSPLSPFRQTLATVLPLIPSSIRRELLKPVRELFYTSLLNEKDYLQASAFQEATLHRILREDIREHVTAPLSLPMRWCWGEHDDAMPLWMAYEYAAITTNPQVFVVRGAGHFPHHTHTDLTLQWLEAWL